MGRDEEALEDLTWKGWQWNSQIERKLFPRTGGLPLSSQPLVVYSVRGRPMMEMAQLLLRETT